MGKLFDPNLLKGKFGSHFYFEFLLLVQLYMYFHLINWINFYPKNHRNPITFFWQPFAIWEEGCHYLLFDTWNFALFIIESTVLVLALLFWYYLKKHTTRYPYTSQDFQQFWIACNESKGGCKSKLMIVTFWDVHL